MKVNVTVFLLLICCSTTLAQQVLVPYRVGDKFGLSDDRGNLILPAKYNSIDYIGETFFWYALADSFVQNGEMKYGILNGSKAIISESERSYFKLHHDKLILSRRSYSDRNAVMAYNSRGEQLVPQGFEGTIATDLNIFTGMERAQEDYVFIVLTESAGGKLRTVGVFDKRTEQINWFVKRVHSLQAEEDIYRNETKVVISYTDSLGQAHRSAVTYDKKLMRVDFIVNDTTGMNWSLDSYYGKTPTRNRNSFESRNDVRGDDGYESENPTGYGRRRRAGFALDSSGRLFYGKAEVKIPGAVFFDVPVMSEKPIVYKRNGKFGLVISDTVHTKAVYDSICFFRDSKPESYSYLVGLRNAKRQMKFGIMDEREKLSVPIVYDSVRNGISRITYGKRNDSNTWTFKISKDEIVKTVVYQNGKAGIWHSKYSVPCVYDEFIYNDRFDLGSTAGYISNFLIARQQDKYVVIDGAELLVQGKMTSESYSDLPVLYYNYYYNQKGFKLTALLDPQGRLYYVGSNGVVFKK